MTQPRVYILWYEQLHLFVMPYRRCFPATTRIVSWQAKNRMILPAMLAWQHAMQTPCWHCCIHFAYSLLPQMQKARRKYTLDAVLLVRAHQFLACEYKPPNLGVSDIPFGWAIGRLAWKEAPMPPPASAAAAAVGKTLRPCPGLDVLW